MSARQNAQHPSRPPRSVMDGPKRSKKAFDRSGLASPDSPLSPLSPTIPKSPRSPLTPTSQSQRESPIPSPKTATQPTQPSRTTSKPIEDLTSRIFRFFSTATPETLGAVGAGLAATTYFVLGRVGLVLIGAFGGIALFVAWEARNPDVTRAVHGEDGTDALLRLLEYRRRTSASSSSTEIDVEAEQHALAQSFDDFRPETRGALNGLVDAVIRDYVQWWYAPIVPSDQSFPLSSRRTFTTFMLAISHHLSRKRPADVFLDFLTNSSSIVIVFFSELASAFAEHQQKSPANNSNDDGESDLTTAAADVVYNYLASHTESNLANLLNQRQQATKFRMVADDLLEFLDRQTYQCPPARTFLREILASAVLETALQTCSKPEWINGWIVYLLEAGEPDFSQALDAGMQTTTTTRSAEANANAAFADIDGNVGNVALPKGSRRKETAHRKQLSRAEEEMEEAMEEMKRMNQMIADENARLEKEAKEKEEKKEEEKKEKEREEQKEKKQANSVDTQTKDPSPSSNPVSPKGSSSLSDDSHAAPPTPGSSDSPSHQSFEDSSSSRLDSKDGNGGSAASTAPTSQFTSFDQLVPPAEDEDSSEDSKKHEPPPPLTLYNASITIHDEPVADKGRIKSKPSWDFLIQIEPATAHYPGWMIVRKYSDFEKLHEVLRRIATISGATAFTEQHGVLPQWKVHTRGSLRGELERYVRDACWYHALAESEGMKRFLEKDTNNMAAGRLGGGVGVGGGLQAFEAMGKNMLDALANANKGVTESGKVFAGGVSGVLGNLTQKRHSTIVAGTGSVSSTATTATAGAAASATGTATATATTPTSTTSKDAPLQDVTAYTNRLSISSPPRVDSSASLSAAARRSRDTHETRDSLDSQRSSVVSTQPGRVLPMDRRASHASIATDDVDPAAAAAASGHSLWSDVPLAGTRSRRGSSQMNNNNSRASSRSRVVGSISGIGHPRSPSTTSLAGMRMSHDEERLISPDSPVKASSVSALASASTSALNSVNINSSSNNSNNNNGGLKRSSTVPVTSSVDGLPTSAAVGGGATAASAPASTASSVAAAAAASTAAPTPTSGMTKTKQYAALTEGETRVAVELLFAVINELYTLSSAWNIRRTLLAAAKSFLLRPGNPSLVSIQSLLQRSVLDANTADAGVAHLLQTLRQNTMPTEAEKAAWPAEMTAAEKERLRIKARKLLIQSGVPAALMGVMGQTATVDALGRLFDCLQIEEVARGLIFGLMLQAARVVTH